MISFLYGDDKFRLLEKIKKLKEDFFYKNTPDASLGVFDFSLNKSIKEFKNVSKSQGLFSSKKMLIVKNVVSQANKEIEDELINFLKENIAIFQDECDLIFLEEEQISKSSKFFKWLVKNSSAEEFKKLNDSELEDWIKNRFKMLEKEINNEELRKLKECFFRDDLFLINSEILKIVDFIGKEKIVVVDENLRKILNLKIESDIFKTIESVSRGNKKEALRMLHQQLDGGDDSFYILTMYVYQVRNLLKIADLYYGKTPLNSLEISKICKLHHFVVQKSINQLKYLSLEKIKDLYQKLEEIDEKAKTGKLDIRLGLDLLIASL